MFATTVEKRIGMLAGSEGPHCGALNSDSSGLVICPVTNNLNSTTDGKIIK